MFTPALNLRALLIPTITASMLLMSACAGEIETEHAGHDTIVGEQEETLAYTAVNADTKTVGDMIWQACSTSSVKGLSQQLIEEIECMSPGTMKRLPEHPNLELGSAVFPYLQKGASEELERRLNQRSGSMFVTSALRTLPQQYLLHQWYLTGKRCGIRLAASPGRSNHESGLAVDMSNYSTWRTTMTRGAFRWLGSSDPVHFDYTGPSVSLRSKSVLAFQRLWNRNNPNDKIAEDGSYGGQTAARLKKSPAIGFAKGASCTSAPAIAEQAIEVYWNHEAETTYKLRALAPSHVKSVTYHVDDYPIGSATRDDGANFPAQYTFNYNHDTAIFEVRGYDDSGVIVARGRGLIDVHPEKTGVYIRQLGQGFYAIGLERAPEGVSHISVTSDDWELGDSIGSDRLEVRYRFNQLGERSFAITTYNADGTVRGTLRRTFEIR